MPAQSVLFHFNCFWGHLILWNVHETSSYYHIRTAINCNFLTSPSLYCLAKKKHKLHAWNCYKAQTPDTLSINITYTSNRKLHLINNYFILCSLNNNFLFSLIISLFCMGYAPFCGAYPIQVAVNEQLLEER